MTTSMEAFASAHADAELTPLKPSAALGPVLATPAYVAYATGVAVSFTLGIISDAVGHTEADEFAADDLEAGSSADELIRTRIDGLR